GCAEVVRALHLVHARRAGSRVSAEQHERAIDAARSEDGGDRRVPNADGVRRQEALDRSDNQAADCLGDEQAHRPGAEGRAARLIRGTAGAGPSQKKIERSLMKAPIQSSTIGMNGLALSASWESSVAMAPAK